MKKTMNLKDCNAIPFTDQQLKRMADMYKLGHSSRKISAIFGISQTAVLRRLHTMGVKVRDPGSKEENARLLAKSGCAKLNA